VEWVKERVREKKSGKKYIHTKKERKYVRNEGKENFLIHTSNVRNIKLLEGKSHVFLSVFCF
jgi:hypothetical protein